MRLAPERPSRRPEVMISPLIDVIFLLLIFYAVTTQFVSDQRLKLKLPEAKTAETTGHGKEQPPIVKIAEDGTVWIDEQVIGDTELEGRLRQLVENSPEGAVILKGDRNADYGVVVRVLDIARQVGAKSIQMSAHKPPAPSE